MAEFPDHFAPLASAYAAFRPTYPPGFIAHLAELAPARTLAWDVGTGSGQAARLLADHFAQVHATDASARQLQAAAPHPRITFVVAPAERSGLASASVDLVTVAQALHWFPQDAFHAEVARVLRPGGLLAAWSYQRPRIDPAVDAVVDWFHDTRLGDYWPPERAHVEQRYTTLPFPYDACDVGDWAIEARLERSALLGYLGTWSALRHARDAEGGDPLRECADRLREAWPEEGARAVRWPLVVRAGRVPTGSRGSAHGR
jgi:SAM-dependent methyltransferase